jgi:hypothetical protein
LILSFYSTSYYIYFAFELIISIGSVLINSPVSTLVKTISPLEIELFSIFLLGISKVMLRFNLFPTSMGFVNIPLSLSKDVSVEAISRS